MSTPPPRAGSSIGRIVFLGLLVVVAIVGIAFGVRTLRFYGTHAETDDAQIEGHVHPVLARVAGFITTVAVEENAKVDSGQVLATIDPRDLTSAVAAADADRANAQAALLAAQASVHEAEATEKKTAGDVARYAPLLARGDLSRQEYEAADAAQRAAAARLAAARGDVLAARAKVEQKDAELTQAKLTRSYTSIASPSKGSVSKKSIEVGQYVQAGQPLMTVVDDTDLWVVANYKETQLRRMQPGQPVEVKVDAYPGHAFHARVQSISPATGARFALLPPDNATGNFTKVVQRLPVKIVFTDPADPAHPLRVGMSVTSTVDVDGPVK
jgi:membrane fusion protein (multidrug efflux system)